MTCDGKKNSRRKAYPRSDMSGYASLRQYEGELRFFDVSAREAAALMDAGESFALLAAFANCPWCAAVIPALNDAAIEHGADLLYLNTRRDPAIRRNTEIEGFDEFYARFSELLGADEHGAPRFGVPHVFFVRKGSVVYDVRGDPSGLSDPREMNEEKRLAQKTLYGIGFSRMKREALRLENGLRLSDEFLVYDSSDGVRLLAPTGGAQKRFRGLVRLNATGADIVELLREETTQQAIAAAIAEEYGLPAEQIEADVASFFEHPARLRCARGKGGGKRGGKGIGWSASG